MDGGDATWIAPSLATPGSVGSADAVFGGAGGVVAAVVSVPDVPSGELMVGLHRALASGASLSQAVRLARQGIDTTDPTGFVTSVAYSCYGGG